MNRSLFLPLMLIVLGSVWFLKTADLLPATYSVVAIVFALFGMAVFVCDGINKQSVVAAPLLMYLGAAVYLYHETLLGLSALVSAGMVFWGVLLLLSRSSIVPDKHARPFPPQD